MTNPNNHTPGVERITTKDGSKTVALQPCDVKDSRVNTHSPQNIAYRIPDKDIPRVNRTAHKTAGKEEYDPMKVEPVSVFNRTAAMRKRAAARLRRPTPMLCAHLIHKEAFYPFLSKPDACMVWPRRDGKMTVYDDIRAAMSDEKQLDASNTSEPTNKTTAQDVLDALNAIPPCIYKEDPSDVLIKINDCVNYVSCTKTSGVVRAIGMYVIAISDDGGERTYTLSEKQAVPMSTLREDEFYAKLSAIHQEVLFQFYHRPITGVKAIELEIPRKHIKQKYAIEQVIY